MTWKRLSIKNVLRKLKKLLVKQEKLKLVILDSNQKYPCFCCREKDINTYFNDRLQKDVARYVNAAYLLYYGNEIVGFFTLCQHAVKRERQKHKGHFSQISATLLGQFAINERFCGKYYKGVKYSNILLEQALNIHVKIAKTIGSTALILNPINDTVKEKFYKKIGLFEEYHSQKDNDYMYAKTQDIISYLEK